MRPTPEEGRPPGAPAGGGVRPGALSALLQDLVRPEGAVESDWSATLRPGAVIGRFELVRELGRGGFGVVWAARDRTLGRPVAFKAIRTGGGAAGFDERVQREAEAAARLSHPNIVTLHDVGSCEDGPYLVLELLRGQTLAQRLEQGRLSVREAVRVAHEVAKGLAHAHAQGVVHRDLAPGNVFLCEDGQVKILDLGMAHAFGRRKLEGGTPAYMAPEQSQGAPEDERSDVYALGVVLYRMLADELPFQERLRRVLPAPAAPPQLSIAEAPGLGDLVSRMLARDPVQRPRDASVVRDALAAIQQELERTPSSGAVTTVRKRRRWPIVVSLGTVAALVAVTALVLVQQRASVQRSIQANASVAVLPFADMSPQKDQEYFADGLSEEILNALANVEGLRVAGRTSSFAFKGKGEDLRTIGQQLNVASVLEGSVRKAGNRVRITAQLINLADGFHLWSETFDRELTDIFAVQDEIARAVAGALRGKLLGSSAPVRPRSTNPEAYTQYLLGKQWYARFTADSQRRAVEAFEKAIALDPSYAPAWAGLSVQLYNLSTMHPADEEEARKLRQRAEDAAERAIALDPQYGEGYGMRGIMRGYLHWDWVGAQADMDRAIALSPGDATTLRRRALLLGAIGRRAEALEAARTATELDPLFPANWQALANMYVLFGDWKQARAALERVREIAPEYVGLNGTFAMLTLLEGDAASALEQFRKLKDPPERLMGTAAALHVLGRTRESQQAFDEAAALLGDRKPMGMAMMYAYLGDRDRAFEWLDRAYQRGKPALSEIKEDWFLTRTLQDDPRWAQLLRKMNLPVP